MKMTKATLGLLLSGVLLISCGEHNPIGPAGAGGLGGSYSLLPPGARIDSAHLLLHVQVTKVQTVILHPQQSAWNERTVTWSLAGSALSPFVLATFRARDTGWVKVDVTGTINLWLGGVWANHGFLLDQNAPDYLRTEFSSREQRTLGPRVKIYCSMADSSPVYVFSSSADALVKAAAPTENFGSDSVLQTGWTDTEPGELRSLIAFDFSELPAQPTSSLGDRVWLDADRDGSQDPDEHGIAGVTVTLHNCSDQLLGSTVTDANGHYSFDSLEAGSYELQFTHPEGFEFTGRDQADSDLEDSDADPQSGRTTCCELGEGSQDSSWDAGLVPVIVLPDPQAVVGDRVWHDFDADGIQDEGEPGMAGVEVALINCDLVMMAMTTTGAEGEFVFDSLEAGGYRLRFSAPSDYHFSPQVEGDWAVNSDADPESGLTECFELSENEVDATRDAGLYVPAPEPTSGLGDRVWLDVNLNGFQDAGEEGVSGVGVVLLNCEDVVLADTQTDALGHYGFESLPEGSYRLRFIAPAGRQFVPAESSDDTEVDSDADPSSGLTACIQLSQGQVDLSRDAGLFEPAGEPSGCTRTRCFWKDHAGLNGDPDWISQHLPILLGSEGGAKSVLISDAATAGRLLSYGIMGGSDNGITKLYAELLAVRLNMAEGASAEAIQNTLQDVDAFLAGACWQDWCGLPGEMRCRINHWSDTLNGWNRGLTGPGACVD